MWCFISVSKKTEPLVHSQATVSKPKRSFPLFLW